MRLQYLRKLIKKNELKKNGDKKKEARIPCPMPKSTQALIMTYKKENLKNGIG